MRQLQFDSLVDAIAGGGVELSPIPDLDIPAKPRLFVAPMLTSNDPDPLRAEILFVSAPAAVGKSTVATELAARKQLPRLNLAKVPVGSGSLVGLISKDVASPSNPLEKFHQGELTIVIDAPDEGRLLSGDASFEAFLETSWRLLLSNRDVINRPKLIVFGRNETLESAILPWLQLTGEGIVSSRLELAFFDEPQARELIDANARASRGVTKAYLTHPTVVKEAVDKYFDAIAQAIGLGREDLWSAPEGRAFAGYAPVLSALGELLAREENFKELGNRLVSRGAGDAWDVIEDVALRILTREREHFCVPLEARLKASVPAQAYDPYEQLTLVTQFVHVGHISETGRVPLTGADLAVYREMVQQRLPEHPFVRGGGFSNAVLGSMTLAHAVCHDLLRKNSHDLLRELSRQPFLWRSIRTKISNAALLDGAYVGCVLNSLWSDPVISESKVSLRTSENEDGMAIASLSETRGRTFTLQSTMPVEFYGQLRNCDAELSAEVICRGETVGGSTAVFSFRGDVKLVADEVTFDASEVLVEARRLWLEAKEVRALRQPFRLQISKDSEYGWGGRFLEEYPWSTFPPKLVPHGQDLLAALVDECVLRLPPGGTLTLNADYSPPSDDARLRWIQRDFGPAFATLIDLMIQRALAEGDKISAHGPDPKVKVRFGLTWRQLQDVVHGRQDSVRDERLRSQLVELIEEARRRVGHSR